MFERWSVDAREPDACPTLGAARGLTAGTSSAHGDPLQPGALFPPRSVRRVGAGQEPAAQARRAGAAVCALLVPFRGETPSGNLGGGRGDDSLGAAQARLPDRDPGFDLRPSPARPHGASPRGRGAGRGPGRRTARE